MLNIKLAHVLEYPADGAQTPQSIYMNATQFIYRTYYLESRSVASPGFFFFFFKLERHTGGNKNQAGCNSN